MSEKWQGADTEQVRGGKRGDKQTRPKKEVEIKERRAACTWPRSTQKSVGEGNDGRARQEGREGRQRCSGRCNGSYGYGGSSAPASPFARSFLTRNILPIAPSSGKHLARGLLWHQNARPAAAGASDTEEGAGDARIGKGRRGDDVEEIIIKKDHKERQEKGRT